MANMERTDATFQSKGQILDYFQDALQQVYVQNTQQVVLKNESNDCYTSLAIQVDIDRYYAQYLHIVTNELNENSKSSLIDISNVIVMVECKRIAIVAHNNKNTELIECLRPHRSALLKHRLYSTDTTGSLIEKELELPITKYKSGSFGGEQQLGAKITSRELDILIFFVDSLDSHPDTGDMQALLRLAQVYGIVCATTAATVDFLLSSPMMNEPHIRTVQLGKASKSKIRT